MIYISPLRYPGGKRKLSNFIRLIYHLNNIVGGTYIEPYAGGASVALSLLDGGYVKRIYINDINPSLFSFWHCVLNETEELCQKIHDTHVTMDEWYHQKSLQSSIDISLLDRGFSTFFLNRTNRSGIITGGVIGGKQQIGEWLIDARYNKKDLINRIQKIAGYNDQIDLYNLDALDFLKEVSHKIEKKKTLAYLDPPYFIKGKEELYTNFYSCENHATVSEYVKKLKFKWVVSYDNVPEIRSLYHKFRAIEYDISYSAQKRYSGKEVMFFCDSIKLPEVVDPSKIPNKGFEKVINSQLQLNLS
jgi:DNA adenine methylase